MPNCFHYQGAPRPGGTASALRVTRGGAAPKQYGHFAHVALHYQMLVSSLGRYLLLLAVASALSTGGKCQNMPPIVSSQRVGLTSQEPLSNSSPPPPPPPPLLSSDTPALYDCDHLCNIPVTEGPSQHQVPHALSLKSPSDATTCDCDLTRAGGGRQEEREGWAVEPTWVSSSV